MKTLVIDAPRTISIISTGEPEVLAKDVLIEVTSAGLCGTDLKTYQGENPLVEYPLIPGHEISGRILETGPGVPIDIRPGQTVTVIPYTSCGACSSCRAGRYNCCRYNQTYGVGRDGLIRERVAVPYDKVMPVQGLDSKAVVLIEPFSVGYHAARRAGVRSGQTVLVFGCGLIGLSIIYSARSRGARIIAADIADRKLSLARSAGAEFTINLKRENLQEKLESITSGHGPQTVFEAVGHPSTYAQALDSVGYAGTVVCIGYSKEPVSVDTKEIVRKELDILGSRNAEKEDFQAVLSMMAACVDSLLPLISHRFDLSSAEEAFSVWDTRTSEVDKMVLILKENE